MDVSSCPVGVPSVCLVGVTSVVRFLVDVSVCLVGVIWLVGVTGVSKCLVSVLSVGRCLVDVSSCPVGVPSVSASWVSPM